MRTAPAALMSRFTRVECRTPRAEIFRFELDFCTTSNRFSLTCNLSRTQAGRLDFTIDQRDRILITDSAYMNDPDNCIEDEKFNGNHALEVKPAFRRRGIAHALLGVLVQWGKSEGLTGITIPRGYHEHIPNLAQLGFIWNGTDRVLDFTPQLAFPISIR